MDDQEPNDPSDQAGNKRERQLAMIRRWIRIFCVFFMVALPLQGILLYRKVGQWQVLIPVVGVFVFAALTLAFSGRFK